jgi:AraC family transcriptional activator FtrA
VVSPHREGGQAQFIDKPAQITAGQLAEEAQVSKRTLSRRFAEATGTSPLDWIAGLRVRRAKDLLETTSLSVEEVAERCGFRSAAVLRHHFRTRVKVSPNNCRNRFHQMAQDRSGA